MSAAGTTWIGADPGGKERFGVAILKEDGCVQSFCVSCADEAVERVGQSGAIPAGVGVDAPLWWSAGRSSDRSADEWLRKKYGLSGGQVQTANSLRGAALVQGAMFVLRMREKFPNVRVTETHPKAVLVALKENWGSFFTRFSVR